jgi:hypothetical protein
MTERNYTTDHSYQGAVQALKTHLGNQWQGTEADGRDEMLDILTEHMGYSRSEASDAIDAMIASGSIRYHIGDHIDDDLTDDSEIAAEVPAVPVTNLGTGAPLPVPVVPLAGHWDIGEGVIESSTRKGQVTPS